MEEAVEQKLVFNVALLGDSGVGKTSLLMKYCDKTFRELYTNTIGVDFRQLKFNDGNCFLFVWDTAGQERFRSLAKAQIKKAHAFIYAYDISSRSSFASIEAWRRIVKDNSKQENSAEILVGMKSDIVDRQVETKEGENYAKLNNMLFYETSSKNNVNVEESFESLKNELVSRFSKDRLYLEWMLRSSESVCLRKLSEGEDLTSMKGSENNKKCSC